MKKRRNIIIAVGLLTSLSGLFTLAAENQWFGIGSGKGKNGLPDAKEELAKLYAKYSNPDTVFGVKGTIFLYDRENKDALKERTPFSYVRNKLQMESQLGYLFTYVSDSIALQVDTLNKLITISKFTQDTKLTGQSGLPFDQLMQDTSALKITATVTEEKGLRKLNIINEFDTKVRRSAIYYDTSGYRIKKAEIEWWKEAMFYNEKDEDKKTWLTIMEYEHLQGPVGAIADKINEIIIWEEGVVKPAKKFQGYQVVNTY